MNNYKHSPARGNRAPINESDFSPASSDIHREVSLREVYETALRNRVSLLLSFLFFFAITFLTANFMNRSERISSLIVEIDAKLLKSDLASEVYTLQSLEFATEVAEDMRLHENPDFIGGRGVIDRLSSIFGSSDSNNQQYTPVFAASKYLDRLSVDAIKGTKLVEMKYRNLDSSLATSVLNAHAKLYLKNAEQRRISLHDELTSLLKSELQATEQILSSSESGLQTLSPEMQAARLDALSERRSRLIELERAIYNANAEKELSETGKIIEEATILNPENPNMDMLKSVVLSIFLGVMLSALVLLAIFWFDSTVGSLVQFEQLTQLLGLGSVPLLNRKGLVKYREEYFSNDIGGSYAEAIQSLKASIVFAKGGALPKSLLLTSSEFGEGSTTLSKGLAVSFAQSGTRTLLIDANFLNSELSENFGSRENGLSDYLANTVDKKSLLISTVSENLSVMSAGSQTSKRVDFQNQAGFESLINSLEQEYDLVIVDSPPVGRYADAIILSTAIESIVFVAAAYETSRAAIEKTIRGLKISDAPFLGVVLNKIT